jgi:uncharacterized protein
VLRVVFDTVVLVRALLNASSPCGRLIFERLDELQLFASPATLSELVAVLNRPELTRKSPRFSEVEIGRLLALVGRARVMEPERRVSFERDPKDAAFLELALAAGADYLVNEDQDLLSLESYEGTGIVTCRQFLALLEGR